MVFFNMFFDFNVLKKTPCRNGVLVLNAGFDDVGMKFTLGGSFSLIKQLNVVIIAPLNKTTKATLFTAPAELI